MKRLFAILFFISFLCANVIAQRVDDSLRYAESIWSMKKKAMILEELRLTEAEKSSFWPVYESYANAIQFLDMEYLRLLNYVFTTPLKEKKMASLCEHLLENDLLLAKTRKQYYKKFMKALTPTKANQFMQLDSDFRTMLRMEAQKDSPAIVSAKHGFLSRN